MCRKFKFENDILRFRDRGKFGSLKIFRNLVTLRETLLALLWL